MESPSKQQPAFSQAPDKFARFKQWFSEHGGLQRDINFPVKFQPGDYLGLSARTQIPPNTVILAVPKQLVVSLSRARQSQLNHIYPKYEIFADQDNDDSDYNVLCLFLIMQKMKGEKSFFWPYIQLLDSSQTVMNWTNDEIETINDPYINLKFIDSVRATFQPIYQAFLEIAKNNKDLFPQVLTRKTFDEMYAAVMTRGFGWGLPETMLVPYADFLNHSSTGVNHYVFDRCLEDSTEPSAYIKKKQQLNLSIFPTITHQTLPIDYQPNIRQAYIQKNLTKLKQMNLLPFNTQSRMDPTITNPLYNMLTQPIIQQNFDDSVYLSTDSQDNDSDSEAEGLEQSQDIDQGKMGQPTVNKLGTVLMARKYLRFAFKQVDRDLDERFTEPKPNVNAEFEEGVKFDWWFQRHDKKDSNNDQEKTQQSAQNQYPLQSQIHDSKKQTQQPLDKYFIVSSSRKLYPNQQIYNCYGRRSNRFLLIWYGFCFQQNKYDSVPFRVWSQQITKRTGHTVYTRFLTQTQYRQGIPLGNERFNAYMLSEEFRLKSRRVDYRLVAFLRYRFLTGNRVYKELYKGKGWHIERVVAVHMEIQCWLQYQRCLNQVARVFGVEIKGKEETKEEESAKYSSAREYFRSILQKSNEQIIVKNILAVNQVLKVLYELQTYLQKQQAQISKKGEKSTSIAWQTLPKQLLVNLYKTAFDSSQKQHPYLYNRLDIISGRSRATIRKQLKLMIREYFRMLSRYQLCRTLYTEFR